MRISSGRSQFTVRTHCRWRTSPGSAAGGRHRHAAGRRLADALRQVVRAASNDDARPVLTGVLMAADETGLRLVATDSYRLAVRDLPGVGRAGGRAEGAAPVPGADRAAAAARPGPRRWRCASASYDATLRRRPDAADHPADRRRLPQLRQPDPQGRTPTG